EADMVELASPLPRGQARSRQVLAHLAWPPSAGQEPVGVARLRPAVIAVVGPLADAVVAAVGPAGMVSEAMPHPTPPQSRWLTRTFARLGGPASVVGLLVADEAAYPPDLRWLELTRFALGVVITAG